MNRATILAILFCAAGAAGAQPVWRCGNSYSQQDIQRTGATNIGQALQMLDPSITVHGH